MFYSGGPISLLFLYISVHLAKVIALELSHNTLLLWSPLEPTIFQKSEKGDIQYASKEWPYTLLPTKKHVQ
jgi:hypothetical protein